MCMEIDKYMHNTLKMYKKYNKKIYYNNYNFIPIYRCLYNWACIVLIMISSPNISFYIGMTNHKPRCQNTSKQVM